jgi:excisionase family DNA binding protein
MTVEEVSKRMQVTKTTVQRWIRNQKLKAVKIGKSWRITEQELKRFFDQGANMTEQQFRQKLVDRAIKNNWRSDESSDND